MLLKSITLENFRQYKDKQKITFSTDKEKNVTIILGDNTSGKTTIIQAFTWALYGSTNFNSKELLNIEVLNDMNVNDKKNVEVEIELEHDNTEYIVTRSQEYICDIRGVKVINSNLKVSYRQGDGQTIPIRSTEKENTINKILPSNLANYFFFDTERIGNISNKNDLTDSVKGLMGLTILDNAIKHLNPGLKTSVIGRLNSSLDRKHDENSKSTERDLEKYTNRIEEIKEKCNTINQQRNFYNNKKDGIEEILRENASTGVFQSQKDKLESEIKSESAYLDGLQKDIVNSFNNNSYAFFAQPLMKKAIEILKTSKRVDKGIPNMNASAIDYIIKRGRCICGCDIREGSEVYNNIIKERELLPPKSIGTIINHFVSNLETLTTVNSGYYDNINSKYKSIRRCLLNIQDKHDEVDNICKKIENKPDVRVYTEELHDIKKKLDNLNYENNKLMQEQGSCKVYIEKLQKVYDSQAAVSEKNKIILEYIRYAENIYDWLRDTYDSKENDIKIKLNEKVNDIFKKMYHGDRRVVIDNKYRVQLITLYGGKELKTDESRGLETVKNFAFIAGLADLAREKVNGDSGDIELKTEPYPLVMDAPFSMADERHVSNISKVLPEIAEQVIMVLMEKDWNIANEVMESKVGKKYKLSKVSETLTKVREVNN